MAATTSTHQPQNGVTQNEEAAPQEKEEHMRRSRRFIAGALIAASLSVGGMTATAKHVFADGCSTFLFGLPVGIDQGGAPPDNGRSGVCVQTGPTQWEIFLLDVTNTTPGGFAIGQSVGVENFPTTFKEVPGYHVSYIGASGSNFVYEVSVCTDIDIPSTCLPLPNVPSPVQL